MMAQYRTLLGLFISVDRRVSEVAVLSKRPLTFIQAERVHEINPSYIVVGPRLEDTAENRAAATACLRRAVFWMIRDGAADMGTKTYFQQIRSFKSYNTAQSHSIS